MEEQKEKENDHSDSKHRHEDDDSGRHDKRGEDVADVFRRDNEGDKKDS